jgi:hypothetical protein
MTERDRVIQRIRAVQALAERGVAGEQENAAAMFERLLKRYELTETDIAAQERRLAWFSCKTELEKRLLIQIIYSVTGDAPSGGVSSKSGRKVKKMGIECTAAERMEIEISFEFFSRALNEELERFYHAFINKNDIFPSPEIVKIHPEKKAELSLDEQLLLNAMMNGMNRHTRRAMIESGGSQ